MLLQSLLYKEEVPCEPAFISCHGIHLSFLLVALWLWSCDPHFLGCRCEAPSTTGLALLKQRLSFRCGLWPGSLCSLSLGSFCPRDYNDLESNNVSAAGGPPELSHRPGNSALGRLSQADWVLSIWPASLRGLFECDRDGREHGNFLAEHTEGFPVIAVKVRGWPSYFSTPKLSTYRCLLEIEGKGFLNDVLFELVV